MTYEENSTNPTPATGVVGTVLGGAALALGSGILGGNGFLGNNSTQQQLNALQMENSILKANADTDAKLVEVYSALRVADKNQDANVAALQLQIANLSNANTMLSAQVVNLQNTVGSVTKTVIPNSNVCPGWGNIVISPTSATTASA